MTQGPIGNGADIFARYMQPVVQQRPDLSADHQRLSSTRAGTVSNVLDGQRMRVRRFGMRGQRDADGVILNRPGDRNGPNGFSHFENLALSKDAFDFWFLRLRRAIEDG